MVVGVDARELCNRPAGKGQYLTRVIASWIPRLGERDRLILYVREGGNITSESLEKLIQSSSQVELCEARGRGPLWHRGIAKRLKKDGVNAFFASLSYLSALFNKIPTLTVVHDLAVFRLAGFQHNRKSQIIERLTLSQCARRSSRMVAVSENTKKDVIDIVRVKPEKIEVIGEAAFLAAPQAPLAWSERDGSLLFVGTLEPRKNISTLLRAYTALSSSLRETHLLKLVGKEGWGGEDYRQMASDLGVADQVHFLGYVSDEELAHLYRKASLMVYPSIYEGFGLPVIEAMSVGTPVVTSNTSSIPEVVGDTGICCTPTDEVAIATAITELLENKELWQDYSERSYKRSQLFSWDKVGIELWKLLAEISTPANRPS